MLAKRRARYYGAICLAIFLMVCVVITETPRLWPWGRVVLAPASLDGMATISLSPDSKMIFITCAPYHPSLLRRLFHSTLSGAFMVQRNVPIRSVSARAGSAHIDYQENLLSVVYADSSRFVFSTAPGASVVTTKGDFYNSVGIGTYSVAGIGTHAAFVASHDWTKRYCGI
jgi:hypothetical protein